MEGDEQIDSIYGFEVVDEWSESEGSLHEEESGYNHGNTSFMSSSRRITKPTEDNRKRNVNTASFRKLRSPVEKDHMRRQERQVEQAKLAYSEDVKNSGQTSRSNFSRERFNSRREMFNERTNRDKRRTEVRGRERSRSRSRERRRQRSRSKSRRDVISLSPSPPRKSLNEDSEKNRSYQSLIKNSPYIPPDQPAPIPGNQGYMNQGNMVHPGARPGLVQYPINNINPMVMGKYPSYNNPAQQFESIQNYNPFPQQNSYPVQPRLPEPGYHNQQGYPNYGPGQQVAGGVPWSGTNPSSTISPHDPVRYPLLHGNMPAPNYFVPPTSHNVDQLPLKQLRPAYPGFPHSQNEMGFGKTQSPHLKRKSRSKSPEPRKSHKKKSKKHSRSPDSRKSKSSKRDKESPSSYERHESRKKPKMIIDPNRIPTPPPPPVLSSVDNKPEIPSDNRRKSSKESLSEMLNKETVSLSCLLEAVMENSGQGKSQVSNPKVKNEILSQCENKIRQLYKKRIAGMGAFIPDPIVARQVNTRGSPLIIFHPHISYNNDPEDTIWTCPGIKVPSVKQVDASYYIMKKPAPISTLVSESTKSDMENPTLDALDSQENSYEPVSNLQTFQDPSSWTGYGSASTLSYPASYNTNTWVGNYNQVMWQGVNQQMPSTYQQQNLVTYPSHPSELKNVAYPLERSSYPTESANVQHTRTSHPSELKNVAYPLERSSYASESASSRHTRTVSSSEVESPPFKYKHRPRDDILLLAGSKKSTKKFFKEAQKKSQSSVDEEMKRNYVVSSYNPNVLTLIVEPSSKNTIGVSGEEMSKTATEKDRKSDEAKKPSLTKKESDLNPVDDAKEKFRRKFWNLRRTTDGVQCDENYDRDDRCFEKSTKVHERSKKNEHSSNSQKTVKESEVIIIEDTDYREAYLEKHHDSLKDGDQAKKTSSKCLNNGGSSQPDGNPKDKDERSLPKLDKPLHEKENLKGGRISNNEKNTSKNMKNNLDIKERRCDESRNNLRKIEESHRNESVNNAIAYESTGKNKKREGGENELLATDSKLTLNHLCSLGPEIRKIQEKSLLYNGIIESLEKGDQAYRRLYTFRNNVLCKMEKGVKRLRIVVPRDNLKDLVVLIHKNFHNISQEEMFKSVKDCIYPNLLHVNKCINKVFSECPNCELQPSKAEPLLEKKVEKKPINKTEKKPETNPDKEKMSADSRKSDGSSKKRDFTHSSSPPRHKNYTEKGKKQNEIREPKVSSDGRPSGYEKATKSRIQPLKKDIVKEKQTSEDKSNISEDSNNKSQTEKDSDKAIELPVSEKTNVKDDAQREEKITQEMENSSINNDTEKQDEGSVRTTRQGLDFKSRIREVQIKEFGDIISAIESGDKSNSELEVYSLKGGMLCKKVTRESGTEVKIVAPLSEVDDVIEIVHTMSSLHTPAPKVYIQH